MYLSPLAYVPYKTRSHDTIARKIWVLNSQYYVFVTQTRVCVQHTHEFWCVCTNTGGGCKYVILEVRPPYFGGELLFSSVIGSANDLGGCVYRKSISR